MLNSFGCLYCCHFTKSSPIYLMKTFCWQKSKKYIKLNNGDRVAANGKVPDLCLVFPLWLFTTQYGVLLFNFLYDLRPHINIFYMIIDKDRGWCKSEGHQDWYI